MMGYIAKDVGNTRYLPDSQFNGFDVRPFGYASNEPNCTIKPRGDSEVMLREHPLDVDFQSLVVKTGSHNFLYLTPA